MAEDFKEVYTNETFGDVKPLSTAQEKKNAELKALGDDVLADRLPKTISVYNVGKATEFSAKQANLAKYATYGSEIYGKLGFDPFVAGGTKKKSGMDVLYDDKTSWSTDIGRAWDGMWKLAGIGVQDTFALNSIADQGNYLDFENTMNKYSSSREGNAGFWANTMLSSGYTVGIIGGIAMEEAALAGITALSGLTAAPATAIAGATILTQGLERIKTVGNLLSTVNKLQDVKTASSWLGKNIKSVGKALNPLENTIDFVKDVEHLKTLNGWKQAATGVGAVVRDARKIVMSHSESKLEADMAAKEFKQKMFDDYFKDPNNDGIDISDNKLKQIQYESDKMYDRIYGSNFALIYATNAITFDNMFKNMKSSRKVFNLLNDSYKVAKMQGGKVAVDVVAKTFGNAIRKKVGQITFKGSLKSALSSSMEGVQELGQDVISETFKAYHARNVKGTQVRGGMYDLLHTDLKNGLKGIANQQGLSTFLSGAFMGVFASPVGFASGQVNQFIAGGGAQNTYERAFNNKAWKAEKITIEAKRKEKAKELTEFFNNNKNFIDGFSNPIYTQNELQEIILNAAENNDTKAFKTAQHESFVTGVHKLLEAGLENEFAEHLEEMAKQFGPSELNNVFARADITVENQNKWKNKLKTQAAEIKNLRGVYNEIRQSVTNPISLKGLKMSDPQYLQKLIKYTAFENFKKELLFSHSKIADKAARLTSIKEDLNNQSKLSSYEVNSLIDQEALNQQVELLKLEVDANDKMNLTGTGLTKSKQAKEKLKAYEIYSEKVAAYKEKQKNPNGVIYESETFDDLFEAYNNLIIASDKYNIDYKLVIQSETEKENNKKVFEKVFDYITLGQENEFYQEYVDTLMNPTGSADYLNGQEAMLQRLDDNKEEHISNALKAFEEKTISDDMLNALYDAGLFFDLKELDDLINNRIMPSEIFDITNNKEATPEQIIQAQRIVASFIKKLTGKNIISAKTSLNKQGRKFAKDKRTVATIIRQYNIKLDKEIKLSSIEGKRLFEKLIAKENRFLSKIDREILEKLGEQDVVIKFVTNGSLPVTITTDGVIELDLRYTGKDYNNSVMSFENLMVTGLTQNKIAQRLKEDDNLWLAARHAMEQAKKAYIATYSDARVEELDVFDYPDLFLTEAMNDLSFQDFLSDINDNTQPALKSLWGTLTDSIKEIVEKDFEKKLVGRVVNIAAKALDSSIVDEIGEKVSETETVDNEAKEAKLKELKTLAKELGLRWNVNVEVLATQEEALKILLDIKDPFFQKFSDILQDALYGPETMGWRLQKGINDVSLKELIADVYNKSESLSELINNLKELSVYETNGKVAGMVEWLVNNADGIGDGLEMVKNIFFQVEGETTGGFYDEKTNTAYIVADAVKPNTAYHEIFLHPFLINLEKSNPEFFKQLVNEARQNAEAVAYVEKNYGTEAKIGARHFEHELVGRVYDLNVNNKLDKTKNAGLIKRIAEFIKKMMSSVAEYFGISKSDVKRINEKKATIADLAKYSVAGTAKMDLGKVIEADMPIATPKTKKVTRERVITTQKDVNKGGNVISLINASDKPEIFGEYLHPEVIYNTPIVDEWTQKIQELGQELDNAGITNWKYGQIRVDVSGRLIIDVSAEVPVMSTTTSTKNIPNAKVVKLKAELDAIERQIQALQQSPIINNLDEAEITAINKEWEKAKDVIIFSKGKFSGKTMPLYQYLRMLDNRMPVVGQYSYYINRDNTTNPSVEKLGVVTSVSGNSFTYVDERGITDTRTVEGAKTIEFNNPYLLFSEAEIKNDVTYSEAENLIKNRRNEKLSAANNTAVPNAAQQVKIDEEVREVWRDEIKFDKAWEKINPNYAKTLEGTIAAFKKYSNYLNLITPLTEYFKGGSVNYNGESSMYLDAEQNIAISMEKIASLYHRDKNNNNDPELIAAVEEALAEVTSLEEHGYRHNEYIKQVREEINAKYNRSSQGDVKSKKANIQSKIESISNEAERKTDRLSISKELGSSYIFQQFGLSSGETPDILKNAGYNITDNPANIDFNVVRNNLLATGNTKVLEKFDNAIKFLTEKRSEIRKQIRDIENERDLKIEELEQELAALKGGVSDKKADIERINKEWQEKLEELNEKNLLSIIHKIKFKDGSTINDLMPNFSVDDANILAETGFKNDLTKQELEAVEKYRTRALRIKQINAKYEADLAALEGATESQKNPNSQKIADLENQKKDLNSQLENEPESIPFSDTQNAQTGTKTVKFLMYKSTGTGSNEESIGEWVPLIAIGKHSNGEEWFVKDRYNGQDPKFDKYGSSTFLAIDKDLKENEALLFDGYENWTKEDVNETIQEEIEVPIDEASEETPFDNVSNRSTQSFVNEAEKIQASIKSIEKKLDKLKTDLESADINFVQRRSIRNKINTLSIEVNDLYAQLNDIQPALQNVTPEQEVILTESEYIPEFDYNNNEIISPETPWLKIPEILRKEIALLYGTALTKLTTQDIIAIKKEMESNPLYIEAIFNFTNNRLNKQDTELGQNELIENQKKMLAAKAARQSQIDDETETNRIAKREARKNKVPVSDKEFLNLILKNADISILSANEIKMLVKKFKDSTSSNPFTAEDLFAYVSNVKLKNEIKIKMTEDYEAQLEIKKLNALIKSNYELLNSKKLSFTNDLNKKQKLTIPSSGMVKFISTYYPEIFTLSEPEFVKKVKLILDSRLQDLKNQDASTFSFKPQAIHLQLFGLVKKLEKAKQLYPETAKNINLALYNAGSNWRISIIKTTDTSSVSTMYRLDKNKANDIIKPVKKGVYEKNRSIVENAELNFSPEINDQLAILKYLLGGGKIKPNALKQVTKDNDAEFANWSNITDENGEYSNISVSAIKDKNLDAFVAVITENSNLIEAVNKYAKLIIDASKAEVVNESEDLLDEEINDDLAIELLIGKGLTKDEAVSELNKLQFLNTPEGIAIQNEEAANIDKYRTSMEAEIANGEFEGDPDELTDSQQDLLNDAENKGFVPEQLSLEFPEEELDAESLDPIINENAEKKELQSEIEKQVTLFFEDTNALVSIATKGNRIFDTFNQEKPEDLVYAAAAFRYIVKSAIPFEQKLKDDVANSLRMKFLNNHYKDQTVIINNKIYRIAGFQQNMIVVQDLVNPNTFVNFSVDEFLSSISKVVKPGEEFNNLNIDSQVKISEFDYIKGAYNEILDNFTPYMSEALALSDEELMTRLKKEITNCK